MESTMQSLATLPRAPPAALYNPLDHGHSLTNTDNLVSIIVITNTCNNFFTEIARTYREIQSSFYWEDIKKGIKK